MFIGVSRFTYIIVDKYFDSEGPYLGFKWLSTAFWNTGVEIFTINIGLLMYYGTLFMPKEVATMFRMVSFFLVSIGFFFLSWILFDDTGITNALEIYFSAATGLFCAKVALSMYKFILAYLGGLKVALREVLDVLINDIPGRYLQSQRKKEYEEECMWPLLKLVNDETK